MDKVELLALIYQLLDERCASDQRCKITDLSFDNDHTSGELFVDTPGANYVIRTDSIEEADDD